MPTKQASINTITQPAQIITENPKPSSPSTNTTLTKPAVISLHSIPTAEASPTSVSMPTAVSEVMAWIYPYAPACNALSEFRRGRAIDILKVEYFTIEDGNLVLLDETNTDCNGYSKTNINLLKQHSRQQFVTMSSADSESQGHYLSNAISDNEEINKLVSFVVDNNLTGIEVDFEDFGGWDSTLYANYKEFVRQLGNALHTSNKQLMIDGPATANQVEENWFIWRYHDFTSLPVDKIVVMAYDYQYDHGAGEPIAPLDWITEVIKWTTARYPKEKLSIGLPSYGYSGSRYNRELEILTYKQLESLPGFTTAKRDDRSAELTWRDGDTIYYYQDRESLRSKERAVRQAGVNSISIWHLGGNQWLE